MASDTSLEHFERKLVCQCGCKGWCACYQMFLYTRYMLKIMADKRKPHHRHDTLPWSQEKAFFKAHEGEELLFRCAMISLKGDWAEHSTTTGFPPWNDSIRPCLCCKTATWMIYLIGLKSRARPTAVAKQSRCWLRDRLRPM